MAVRSLRELRACITQGAFFTLVGLSAVLQAQQEPSQLYSAPAGDSYPKTVLWGDTHLHSQYSADAYSLGNSTLSQADAYRFAQGEPMTAHNGMQVQLRRPLDFLVVSDHAEYLGGYYGFHQGQTRIVDTDVGRQWTEMIEQGDQAGMMAAFVGSMTDPETYPAFPLNTRRSVWQDIARTSDEYNRPGQFTALTGYEWTSMINGNNLHRVVIYKDSADKVARMPPFSAQDSLDPRDLWDALARYEKATGGEVIAIAHNGNLSNGMMFPDKSVDGQPLTAEYAALRARWEPLYEVTQVKGDGEAHPFLSPNDEFADYENWDWDNIGRSQEKENWMLKHEYARSALKLGLAYEQELGVNPFKFGMLGSTDGHNTFSTTQEDNFFGKFPESQPAPVRTQNAMAGNVLWQNWRLVASGYAAVWAEENTRESIFAAMQRREVYATTGSRIQVRFFGGWTFEADDIYRPDRVGYAYAEGVPMGGDLLVDPALNNGAPSFMIMAAKDPDGANLDRVQVIKGWLDKDGQPQEKVFDVAWSGKRKKSRRTGKVGAVGSTVDVKTASYNNSIGTAELATVWRDPDFDPALRSFYYVRVIEIPRPRWTAYDAAFFGLELPDDVPMVVQDRAYTSPIWYTPN